MTDYKAFSRIEYWLSNHIDFLAFFIVVFGFFVYLYYAYGYYLNPDEANHFVFANQETLWKSFLASHSLAHPPLMIIVLHLFLRIGKSVVMLRLLSALFCSAAVWLSYKWIQRTYGSMEAITGLVLLTFSPAMITAASEVRQYAMLIFFISGSLYFMRRFLEEKSLWLAFIFSAFIYGAILTHYSAILIVLTLAIYISILFWRHNPGWRITLSWLLSQIGAFTIYVFLYFTHIKRMLKSGFAQDQIQGYLKNEYFFADKETIVSFISRTIVDYSSFLTGGRLTGFFAIICFLFGILYLYNKLKTKPQYMNNYYDGLLLILPFIIGILSAVFKIMPFGGSRHAIYLLPFSISAIAICLVQVFSLKKIHYIVLVALAMLPLWLSSWHPPNANPDMNDIYMQAALKHLNEKIPAGSVIFVDDMTHYVLSYYLISDRPSTPGIRHETLNEVKTGKYRVVNARSFAFSSSNFEHELGNLSRFYDFKPEEGLWVMSVGWCNSKTFHDFLSTYPPGIIREEKTFGPIMILNISKLPKVRSLSTI